MTPVGFRWAAFSRRRPPRSEPHHVRGVILCVLLTTGRQLTIDLVTIVPLLLLARPPTASASP